MIQISVLHVADDLDSVRTEVVVVSGELKARSGGIRHQKPALFYVSGIVDDLQVKCFDYLGKEYA